MQPGIAFPRALQGETLDFSEPQPNRCWLLESHQKQAFMLLSFFSLSLSLPPCLYLVSPCSLSLTFMLFVPSLSFPSLVCLLSSSSLILLTLSHTLSFLSSLSSATSLRPNLFAECRPIGPVSGLESLLRQTSSFKIPLSGACCFVPPLLSKGLVLGNMGDDGKFKVFFLFHSPFPFIHHEVCAPTFSFLPSCCLPSQFSTHLIPTFFLFWQNLPPPFTLPL